MEKIIEVLEMLLEYSVAKDAAFCFWCFLFKPVFTGDEAFTTNGFRPFSNWKKSHR